MVALIQGEQVTLKRFYVDAEGIRLQPVNPAHRPIILRNEDIEGLIRTLKNRNRQVQVTASR